MEIAYTANHRTQQELRRAYERLDHTPPRGPAWGAALLITSGLHLEWACPVLEPAAPDEPPRQGWHTIARAGELDWPPLRPKEEIWPALLAKEPVPTGERAEREARIRGYGSVEDLHYEKLRQHYFGSAHIGGLKRNPTDVNFDPIVRDWDSVARELAEFVDAHRPPLLTPEQRVMAQGARRAALQAELAHVTESLARLTRNAAREQRAQHDRLRRNFKADVHKWTGASRSTIDAWLSQGGHCEPDVPADDEHAGAAE